ncbi:MAG: hypothetical protein JW966_05735 [Anaerolineae bacterium]|nr:hypothetical protein [Anaerolineae bacterium]
MFTSFRTRSSARLAGFARQIGIMLLVCAVLVTANPARIRADHDMGDTDQGIAQQDPLLAAISSDNATRINSLLELPTAQIVNQVVMAGDQVAILVDNRAVWTATLNWRQDPAALGSLFAAVGGPAPEGVIVLPHDELVVRIAISPDGRLIATGALDALVRVWDAASGTLAQTLAGHGGPIWNVVFSPDGTRLASNAYPSPNSGSPSEIHVWDLATGATISAMSGQDDVWSLAFSPDGTLLASGGFPNIWIWDIAAGDTANRLICGDVINDVAFTPDGNRLVSGGNYGATLYNVVSGDSMFNRNDLSYVDFVSISPDGGVLFTAGKTVRVLNTSTGTEFKTLMGPPSTQAVIDMTLSADGTILALVIGNLTATEDIESTIVSLWGITDSAITLPPVAGESGGEPSGPCMAIANGTVNLRSGPSLDYGTTGSLSVGQTIAVTGQYYGADAMTWWLLANGLWVRSDIVTVSGACDGVPVVTP